MQMSKYIQNEIEILEKEELRNQMIERVEVLDKVKKLLLIPYTEVATVKQVAEFYEVDTKVVQRIYERHTDELKQDGVSVVSYKELFKGSNKYSNPHDVGLNIKTGKGKIVITESDIIIFELPTRKFTIFPRRAILRIGMLLRDSKVAKEVRTQLLNIEEKTTNETKTHEIEKEKKLYYNLVNQIIDGNIEGSILSLTQLSEYKNRYINELKNKNENLVLNNRLLSEEILAWDNRSILNKVIRALAKKTNMSYGKVWNMFYDELLYKHHICLKMRGKSSFIQYIKEDEWGKVLSTITAMCEKADISFAEIVNKEFKELMS